jgi:uncharacterized protein YukE
VEFDTAVLTGCAGLVGRAATALAGLAGRLPTRIVEPVGLLAEFVPRLNGATDLYARVLPEAAVRLSRVATGLDESARHYGAAESTATGLLGGAAPAGGAARGIADAVDVDAVTRAIPAVQPANRIDAGWDRANGTVAAAASTWREHRGSDLVATVHLPLAGDYARLPAVADQWTQSARALEAIAENLDAGGKAVAARWRGDAASAFQEKLLAWRVALAADAATAHRVGEVVRTLHRTTAATRSSAVETTGQLAAAVVALMPYLARERSRAEAISRLAAYGPTYDSLVGTVEGIRGNVERAGAAVDSVRGGGLRLPEVPDVRFEASLRLPLAADRPTGRLDQGVVYLADGRIVLVPRDGTVPSVSVPNNVGARGFVVGPYWDVLHPEHTYRQDSPTNIPFDQSRDAVGKAIARDPVPIPWGGSSVASPEGTRVDAGYGNYVRSYTIPSPDPGRFTDIMVNYTISGEHILHEGYAIRYGERQPDGTTLLVSYGEGNGMAQHPANVPAHQTFNWFWRENHDRVAREAGGTTLD